MHNVFKKIFLGYKTDQLGYLHLMKDENSCIKSTNQSKDYQPVQKVNHKDRFAANYGKAGCFFILKYFMLDNGIILHR